MVVYDDCSSRGQCLMSWVLICDPNRLTVNEQIRDQGDYFHKAAHGITTLLTEASGVRKMGRHTLMELGSRQEGRG